jgi:hypothetical protein
MFGRNHLHATSSAVSRSEVGAQGHPLPRRLLALAMLASALLLPVGASRAAEAIPGSGPSCGALDTPETGIQGDTPFADQASGRAAQGYNCGLALVGQTDTGKTQNGQHAWVDHCAYVSSGPAVSGTSVLDVLDRLHPKLVRTLHTPGTESTSETMHALKTKDRAILVSGLYGSDPGVADAAWPLDVFDVSDCENPKLLSSISLPRPFHNLRLSADAKTVYATNSLQVVSIADPRKPVYLGNLENELLGAGVKSLPNHEAVPSPDGKRLYVGSVGGDTLSIIDVEGYPKRKPRLVSQYVGPAGQGHSINWFQRNGRRYLVNSSEALIWQASTGCFDGQGPVVGPAQPWITDITDEHKPRPVGRLTLAINKPENCSAQQLSSVVASSHYHDTYTDGDATFAVVAMWHAGVRVFDLRNPAKPVEVGYFSPGATKRHVDQVYSHIRYDAQTGQLLFSSWNGGFWVVELEPKLRARLGLKPIRTLHPQGTPARPGSVPVPLALAAGAHTGPMTSGAAWMCGATVSSGHGASRLR